MKNDAIGSQASAELPASWREAMALLDQDLRRRGSAEGTRVLYGTDVEELARWAVPYALAPADVDYPWLRRYAAQLAERGLAPRTVARKLAGLRACFRVLVEHGVMEANPAEYESWDLPRLTAVLVEHHAAPIKSGVMYVDAERVAAAIAERDQ